MLLGEFERAWEEADLHSGTRPAPAPSGRVLVRCCRGLGDAIQFLRLAPQLKARCESVTVQAPARILPLLPFLPGIDRIGVVGEEIEDGAFDQTIECSDLPYHLRARM